MALDGDSTAMHLGEVAHEAEPEAEAAVLTRHGRVGLPERFEDVREKARIDALAAVTHAEDDAVAVLIDRDDDTSTVRSELDGVRQEIVEHLAKSQRIAGEATVAGDGVERERDLLRGRDRTHRLDGVAREGREIDGLGVDPQLAGDDARHVEHVVDDPLLGTRVPVDDIETLRGEGGIATTLLQ
jgi:hypothetical protein